MAVKKVVIIGAGLSGLSAGCYSCMNGYDTLILEHHDKPGGVAATWRRKGYNIEGCIHFIMGHRPPSFANQVMTELSLLPSLSVIDLPEFMNIIDEKSGKSIHITPDLDKFFIELETASPADVERLGMFEEAVKKFRGKDMFSIMKSPRELMGFLDTVAITFKMATMASVFSGECKLRSEDFAAKFSDPWVSKVMDSIFMPDVPVWFNAMLLASLADGNLATVDGGSEEFIAPMVAKYSALGGAVKYRTDVARITVEDDKVTGVMDAEGRHHPADIVISAADGYSTIFGMLGGRYANDEIRNRYESWPIFKPLVMASYGVAARLDGVRQLNSVCLSEPLDTGGCEVDGMMVRTFNFGKNFAPFGKTVVQAEVESDWDYWNGLSENRAVYDAEKERVAADILARIEKLIPQVKGKVEMTDVATPFTTWRYTLNHKGAFEGWRPTPTAIMSKQIMKLPGLSGLYMCGQWVVPGGGITTCLISGRHAVQYMCHDDGVSFATKM